MTGTRRSLPVAPTTADGVNDVRLAPGRPLACVRIDDRRFAFDSSFLHPTAADDLDALVQARPPGEPTGGLLALFGHADPTGQDDYNKKLSGRRAKAVFGLLTRDPDVWEALYGEDHGDDRWGTRALQSMLATLGYDPGAIDDDLGPRTKAALEAFERKEGLEERGKDTPATRRALFVAYMKHLARAEGDDDRRYVPDDFLGGASADLRFAVQGCGEHNPVLLPSKAQGDRFKEEAHRAERDLFHVCNRRVVVYVFPRSTPLGEGAWPCPSADAGVADCKKAFWSDVDKRRTLGPRAREHKRRGRTFACKFYDRFGRLSPCEGARGALRVWLLDERHRRMPGAPYLLRIGAEARVGTATARGFLLETNVPLDAQGEVFWGLAAGDLACARRGVGPATFEVPFAQLQSVTPALDPTAYQFHARLRTDIDDEAEGALEAEYSARLGNLGYTGGLPLVDRVAEFRTDYGVQDGGDPFAQPVRDALFTAHREGEERSAPGAEKASGGTDLDGVGCNDLPPELEGLDVA